MTEAVLLLIGSIVGALFVLIPKLIEMTSGSKREKQEHDARLRMLLAGVLMSCVESTNQFLDQAALLLLARTTDGEKVAPDELRKGVNLAFAMKTAWMYALVSFGDSVDEKKPVDDRPMIIADLLTKLDATYDMHQATEVTPDRVLDQLLEIAALSRRALQDLVGLPAVP